MFKEQKQSLKLLEPKRFDICKNAAVLIIAMLGYSEINTEVSDADMETAESDDYREVLRDDRDTNGILVVT